MKAEQRKELETNTLADRMGRVMQRVKGSTRRTFFTYLFIAVAVLLAGYFGWRWYSGSVAERSLEWVYLYDGSNNFIDELAKKKETNASKAARLQLAWFFYWDLGMKMLYTNKDGAMKYLKIAGDYYEELAKECTDDKIFEPQALLGRAVAQESRAVEDREHLKKAKTYYEEVVSKYENSAEADFARKRLEVLKDDAKRQELSATYSQLQSLLGIPAPVQAPKFNDLPGFPDLGKEKK
jgi:hypothetical protein